MSVVSPAGDCPLIVYGLNLSKLVRRSGLEICSVPPFGASALTKSNALKPRGYFGCCP